MTIKALYPATQPSLSLDFANVKALDPRVTFARASSGAVYDGKTVAKAEENLLIRSQEFDNIFSWSTGGAGVSYTANTSVAPDGTTTAETLTASVGTGVKSGSPQANYAVSSGLVYAASLFVKAGTDTVVQLAFTSVQFGSTAFANFDLSGGVLGTVGATATAAIQNVGNGWYRCSIVASCTSSSTAASVFVFSFVGNNTSAARAPSITAAGTETLLIWGAQLEQRSAVTAYTPTTTQPITNYVPVLQSAANNVARFDHNPVTGESLGLLIEEQRTNLSTNSELIENWALNNVTALTNQIVAPDGTQTMGKLVSQNATNIQFTQASAAVTFPTDNVVLCGSAFFKFAGVTRIAFRPGRGISDRIEFNPQTLEVFLVGSNVLNYGFQAVGNDIYRVWVVTQPGNTTLGQRLRIDFGNYSLDYTGDGFSGIYIWGAQLEAGAFPTSYIPTVASQVTRSADAASMTGANFSSWYRADEGTMYGDALFGDLTSGRLIAGISGATNVNRITIGLGTLYNGAVVAGNVVQASLSSGTKTANSKIALAYKTDDFAFSGNSATVVTDTSGILPVVDRMFIGSRVDGNAATFANGHIRKVAYYPKRLADAELQALTQN
jgi:hypothetical protein